MRVRVTEEAEAAVRRVRDSGREDLVIVLGTGCCDSTAPFLYDHYLPGADAVEVGEADGVPVLAPRWLADLYAGADGLEIDVQEDVLSDSLSLESEFGCRLRLRAPPGAQRT